MYFQDTTLADLLAQTDVVIFDMNGLIVDDEPVQLEAVNEVLAPYEIQLSDEQWISQCVGRKPVEYFRELLASHNLSEVVFAQLCDAKEHAYERRIGAEGQVQALIRPGFEAFFSFLTQSPHRIALATSTTRRGMETILGERGLGILASFDFVICGDEVSKAKPHPEIYNKVREHFGDEKSYLVFEDSEFGVKSATNANCTCIAVPNAFTKQQDLSLATYTIGNFLV